MGDPSLGSSALSPLGRSGDLVHYCGTYLGSIESAPSPIWDFWNDLMDIDKDGGILALESGLRGISWMTRSLVRDDSSKCRDSTGITPSHSRLDLRQAMRMSIKWRKYRRGRLCERDKMPGTLWDLLAGWRTSLGIENGQTCSDWRYLILFSGIISCYRMRVLSSVKMPL